MRCYAKEPYNTVTTSNTDTERITRDREGLEQEAVEVREKMAQLKSLLYGKFGDAINLEER